MLYFDESGYTGADLVNSKQPYFSLASIRITDEEIVSVSHLAPIHDIGKTVQTKYHQTKNTLFPSWAINA